MVLCHVCPTLSGTSDSDLPGAAPPAAFIVPDGRQGNKLRVVSGDQVAQRRRHPFRHWISMPGMLTGPSTPAWAVHVYPCAPVPPPLPAAAEACSRQKFRAYLIRCKAKCRAIAPPRPVSAGAMDNLGERHGTAWKDADSEWRW
jgi:hypothetical protein